MTDRAIIREILLATPSCGSLLDEVQRHLLKQPALDLTKHYAYWTCEPEPHDA